MINKITQGDCLEVMKDIRDKSIDMVLTSPPYDNLRTYNGSLEWGEHIWKLVIQQLYRVIKDGGVVVWVVGDATINGSETGTSFKQALYFKEVGFNLHDTMIYEKDGISFPDKNRYQQCFEYMFILSKGKPKTLNLIQDRKNISFGRKVTGTDRDSDGSTRKASCYGQLIKEYGVRWNVWNINSTKGNIKIDHPAIFPEQLAHDHIISWSNEGDIILDPFMGSGTTAIACMNTGRNFIGIEKEPEYVEIARKRILQNAGIFSQVPTVCV